VPKKPKQIVDLAVEQWAIEKVLPYARNARLHTPQQIEFLQASIKEYGFVNPVLVDDQGVLIAGHGRILAAQKIGHKVVPVIRLGHLTKRQADALRIADNRISDLGGYDFALLRENVALLQFDATELSLIGYDPAALAELLAVPNAGQADPEEVPEPPKKPIVRKGDLWMLGKHRLLVDDSTKPEVVMRLMDGGKAHLMATDPPYGVAYDNALRPNPGVAKPRVANDELVDGPAMQEFLESMLRAALPHMEKCAAFYFWHPMLTQGTYVAAAAAAGILIHRQIIWVKPVLLLGRGDYHWRHELCFYGWQKGNRPPFYGPRNQDTIWEVASVGIKERKEMNHATPKPVALWDKPIANHTKAGQIIFEPFAGSGTQIIAAERTGRHCYALELDPANAQVCIERFNKFSGKQATLDGKTLEQVAAARRKGRAKKERTDEASNSGVAVSRKDARGNGGEHPVRAPVHARQPTARRKPAGEPPAMAGDS